MPTLRELLEFMAEKGNEEVWALLDIKLVRESAEVQERVVRAVAETVRGVKVGEGGWEGRVVLGCWFLGTMKVWRAGGGGGWG